MQSSTDSVAVRVLRWLAHSVYHYPRVWFYPQVVLFVLSIVYTVFNLEFNTSRNDLVGADKEYHRNYLTYKKEFIAQD